MPNEIWKTSVSAPMFLVSNMGRVKSPSGLVIAGNRQWIKRETILKPSACPQTGYFKVSVPLGAGKKKTISVHTLVCEAFYGSRPKGYYALHKNGNRQDNVAENLKWGSPAENCEHKKQHGTYLFGEKVGKSKLSDAQRRQIGRLAGTMSHGQIARLFNVSRPTVTRTINKGW